MKLPKSITYVPFVRSEYAIPNRMPQADLKMLLVHQPGRVAESVP